MIGGLLAALKFAPAVFSAGKDIVAAVTGQSADDADTPEALASRIEGLPPDQQAAITHAIINQKEALQKLDTVRFAGLTDGDAEKIKSTARPEIARQAMQVITVFAWCFKILIYATVAEWLVRLGYGVAGYVYPNTASLWSLMAEAAPVTEMIWVPLLASFWASVEIIKKYMGCRERDKAQEFEMRNGAPLSSSAATVEAAGSGLAGIIRAVRGK